MSGQAAGKIIRPAVVHTWRVGSVMSHSPRHRVCRAFAVAGLVRNGPRNPGSRKGLADVHDEDLQDRKFREDAPSPFGSSCPYL